MTTPYYKLEYKGKTYYYNVSLLPFHTFHYKGNSYLLNIEKMKSFSLDREFAVFLNRFAFNPGTPLAASAMARLQQMELIDDSPLWDSPVNDSDSRATGNGAMSGRLREMPVTTITLNVSQICNLNCIYCYGNGGAYGKEGLMDEKIAFQAVDWLVERSGDTRDISIAFFGGEPMMNFPRIQQVVAYGQHRAGETGKRISFSITTNATLLSHESLAFFKTHNITPFISFDGPAEVQDVNRPFKNGQGSHGVAARNIKRFLKEFPQSICSATLKRTDRLDKVKQGIKAAGFSRYFISYASPSLFGNFGPASDNIDSMNNMLDFLANEADATLRAIKNRMAGDMSALLLGRLFDLMSGEKRYFGCNAGRKSLGISVEGDIYPCHRFVGTDETRLGSVYEDEINRETYQKAIVTNIDECTKCWARYFCGGGCMYENMAFKGGVFTPDHAYCETVRFSVKAVIHLLHQLDDADIVYLKEMAPQCATDD